MKRTQKEYSVIKIFVSFAKAGMLSFAFACAGIAVYAQTATVTKNYVAYNGSSNAYCQLTPAQASGNDKSYVTSGITPVNSADPWVNSALIEFAQQKQNTSGVKQITYPNDCLALCANVTCSNPARLVEALTDQVLPIKYIR